MWIVLNDAFFSVVAHREQPSMLMVRSRSNGDLEKYFPHVEVTETPDADYRYRAVVERAAVAEVLSQVSANLNYDNFKNSIPKSQGFRKGPYMDVWTALYRLQR
jgi:hypothetical protein